MDLELVFSGPWLFQKDVAHLIFDSLNTLLWAEDRHQHIPIDIKEFLNIIYMTRREDMLHAVCFPVGQLTYIDLGYARTRCLWIKSLPATAIKYDGVSCSWVHVVLLMAIYVDYVDRMKNGCLLPSLGPS